MRSRNRAPIRSVRSRRRDVQLRNLCFTCRWNVGVVTEASTPTFAERVNADCCFCKSPFSSDLRRLSKEPVTSQAVCRGIEPLHPLLAFKQVTIAASLSNWSVTLVVFPSVPAIHAGLRPTFVWENRDGQALEEEAALGAEAALVRAPGMLLLLGCTRVESGSWSDSRRTRPRPPSFGSSCGQESPLEVLTASWPFLYSSHLRVAESQTGRKSRSKERLLHDGPTT